MEWFSAWFDSPYYHLLYNNRDDVEAQRFVDRILEAIQLKPKAKIVDLACGKGRHSVYMSSKGYQVLGLDLAKESILSAQEKGSSAKFAVHDMRDPIPEIEVDLVVNLFSSFGYFETEKEELQTLANIRNCLAPKGIFVIDFMNMDTVLAHLVSEEVQHREQKDRDQIVFEIKRYSKDGFLWKEIKVKDGAQTFDFHEKVKIITPDLLKTWIEKSGLKVIEAWGDMNLGALGKGSPRVIYMCSKG